MRIETKNMTIRIKDGGSHTLSVKLGEGNFTYDEKRNIQYLLDRGKLDTVREGDEIPVDISLDSVWEEITTQGVSGAAPSVEDAMKQRGPASGWTSSSSDPCEPYAVDIEVEHDPNCTGMREILTFSDFRWESVAHDMKAATIRFSGKANVTQAAATRAAQTT
jgi:hypothetical protein